MVQSGPGRGGQADRESRYIMSIARAQLLQLLLTTDDLNHYSGGRVARTRRRCGDGVFWVISIQKPCSPCGGCVAVTSCAGEVLTLPTLCTPHRAPPFRMGRRGQPRPGPSISIFLRPGSQAQPARASWPPSAQLISEQKLPPDLHSVQRHSAREAD